MAAPAALRALLLRLLPLALSAVAASAPGSPGAGGPAAPPLVFVVARGEEALVRLAGFDAGGRALATTLLTLPAGLAAGVGAAGPSSAHTATLSASAAASVAPAGAPVAPPTGAGAVFELSQLFVTQGLQPRRGRAALAPPLTLAAAAGNRALFVAPASSPPLGMWANLTYRVADGASGRASAPGVAFFVPPHGRLAHSDFRADADGWRVAGKAQLSREGFSRGLLSQYLVATDSAVQSGGARGGSGGGGRAGGGGDANLWRFVAPPSFLGNKVGAYGGALVFTAGAFAGDFAPGQLHSAAPLATLECASCRGGQGLRLGFFADNPPPPPDPGATPTAAAAAAAAASANAARGSGVVLDGRTKRFSLPLAAASWRRDPRNSLLAWPAVADCELVQVLSALSGVTILGDWTTWYETVALDDVMLQTALPFGGIPRACYG
jgi:hypothetical protein